jgi:hypothetical protein
MGRFERTRGNRHINPFAGNAESIGDETGR